MPVYSVKAHSEIINCIDGVGGLGIGLGAPEIVTGSRDGTYIVLFLMHPVITISFEGIFIEPATVPTLS